MAYPSVTNSFTNGAGNTIDATEVNQNFTDIINGFSDGTKDLNMNAAMFSGAVYCYGNIQLGNATSDSIVCTARWASDLVPTGDNTKDLGTSALRWAEIHGVQARISGAEAFKVWTYSHTLDAADILAGLYVFTVTAVTQAKVRAILCSGYDDTGTNNYATTDVADNFSTTPALTATTACTVSFGASWAADDIISLTIIEAV